MLQAGSREKKLNLMKFLLDANIPYSLQEVFPRGHDVFHIRDLNLANSEDQEIADWAKKNKATIVSRDLDFANINNFPPENYYGIVILRVPYFYTAKNIKRVFRNFISKIEESEIPKSTIIVEEGRWRIKKNIKS